MFSQPQINTLAEGLSETRDVAILEGGRAAWFPNPNHIAIGFYAAQGSPVEVAKAKFEHRVVLARHGKHMLRNQIAGAIKQLGLASVNRKTGDPTIIVDLK